MQSTSKAVLASLVVTGVPASGAQASANPIAKVIDLMNELRVKVEKDAETESKAFHSFFEWCDDASKNGANSLKTATTKKDKLEAQIADLKASIDASSAKIEDLVGKVGGGDSELKEAAAVRKQEGAQFARAEKELVETIDALTRALSIVEREMAKGSSFAQLDTSNMEGVLKAMNALVDAAALSAADHHKLVALVQSNQDSEDDDDASGAPAAAGYESHSGGVLDTLENLKDKAETELADLRKAENSASHNFKMLAQSLKDEAKANARHMDEEKTAKADAEKKLASAQGELDVTSRAQTAAQEELKTAQGSCMTTAADHEATVASRVEELKVITQALKILKETTDGAVSQTYSLFQMSSASQAEGQAEQVKLKVVRFLRHLAKKQRSAELAQLASRIGSVARYGSDPFAKIKGLIRDMIAKLEGEGEAAATEKAWCDEQLAKTEIKRSELADDVSRLATKMDVASSKSAQVKAEVKAVQEDLAALAKQQADMDKIRGEENAAYQLARADLEAGVAGVRKALDVLRSYYGGAAALVQQPAVPEHHSQASGAGGSIMDILEVVESDFADNLAKVETEEADAVDEYERVSHENKITNTNLKQDVKYKTQEHTGLDQSVAEYSADDRSAQAELSSVNQYYEQIKGRCIAKPEGYENRAARRQTEIDGLKEALSILNSEASLVQRSRRGNMRGALEAQ